MELRLRKVAARFGDVLAVCKTKIYIIICYSLAISVLTLIVPVSVQALVNIVSFGLHMQPIVILALIILLMLSMAALLRLLLLLLTENIQQKLFVVIALNLAKRLPLIKIESLGKQRGTQLVNYFFEVITVQKSLTRLLLYGIELSTQLLLSMILLAFYHPFLLIFDIILAILIFITVFFPFKNGVLSATNESTEKHRVASWLDELLVNPMLFRFQHYRKFVLEKADVYVLRYLRERQSHFNVLLSHNIGINIIYVLSFVSLLGLGGYLVIHGQLTLGQLVASELLLSIIISNVVKLSGQLDSFYDLLASSDKLGYLFDLPIEENIGKRPSIKLPISLTLKDISYQTLSKDIVVDHLNLELGAGEACVVYDQLGCGKSMLIDVIAGLSEPTHGYVKMNGLLQKEYSIIDVRSHLFLLRDVEIFSGSLFENFTLNAAHVNHEQVNHWCQYFDLENTINGLKSGLQTEINPHQALFSNRSLKLMMLIRLLLSQPALTLIDGFLDDFSMEDFKKIMQALNGLQTTLVIITQQTFIRDAIEKRIFL